MLDELDALFAVADFGTMTRAANHLRITQSAVSKRISSLTERVGSALVEPDGRRVRLTPTGDALVNRCRSTVSELRAAVAEPSAGGGGRIAVGVSESILASWGPRVLAAVGREVPDVSVEFAAHRSMMAIERVRAGEYHLALCAGAIRAVSDLSRRELVHEPIVLVGRSQPPRPSKRKSLDVITIEPGSASWQSMKPQLRRLRRAGYEFQVVRTVQAFAAVVQLSRAGFGLGLAPLGIARALGAKSARIPRPGLTRTISVFARPRTLAQPAVARWVDSLAVATAAGEIGQ